MINNACLKAKHKQLCKGVTAIEGQTLGYECLCAVSMLIYANQEGRKNSYKAVNDTLAMVEQSQYIRGFLMGWDGDKVQFDNSDYLRGHKDGKKCSERYNWNRRRRTGIIVPR